MSELGVRLKTAREEKGYSLDELQRVTKIQKRYLTAIEAGDFSKMPGDFYARAFVKSYSEAVGLDSDMIFEEHKDELPQAKREPADLPPRVNRSSRPKAVRKKSKAASLLPTLIAVIFLVAIGLVIWVFRQGDVEDSAGVPGNNQNSGPAIDYTENDDVDDDNNDNDENNNDENNNEDENNNNDDDNNNDNNEEDEEPQEQSLSFEESDGNRYTFTLSDADEFDVTLDFSGDSWVQVYDSDDDEIHGQGYSDGDEASFDFSDESRVRLNIGNTRVTNVLVNDEELGYENEAVHQHIIIEYED